MSTRHLLVLLTVLAIFLSPQLAAATPISQLSSLFDESLNFFLKRIVPGCCIAILAWNGIVIAMGRKTLMDALPVIIGAAIGLLAPFIVSFIQRAAG